VGVIAKPCFGEQEWKQRAPEALHKMLYRDFKDIESFGYIMVFFQGKDTKKIGLNEYELTDYVKLSFKSNFGKMKYKNMSIERFPSIYYNEAEAKKTGRIICWVWVVGTDYPIAYHIRCEAGNFKDFSIWSDAVLGYSSKRNVLDDVRKGLDKMMERLAIDFFKARSEL